jgi:hypothetical protein
VAVADDEEVGAMRPGPRSAAGRLPRRGTDRLEDAAVWLLFVAGLVVVVLAGAVGFGVYTDATARARDESTERTPVTATVLQDAPFITGAPGSVTPQVLVGVGWTSPDGVAHTAQTLVPSMTRAGQRVQIWLDAAGRPVDEPAAEAGAALAALMIALVVVLVGELLLASAWVGIRHGIGVLTDRGWEREWARVGPQWTGHGDDQSHDLGGRPAD